MSEGTEHRTGVEIAVAPVVRLRGLTKQYGAVTALDAVDLDLQRGEVLGLLGPNGAGKTTMIRLLLGLIRPTAGTATVYGRNAFTDAAAVHAQVAYVPGEAALWPNLTGRQTLHLLGQLHGGVDEDYLDELVGVFDLDVTRRVRAYSKGNRQKLALVAALMTRADLLLLDEPTSGLDPLMEQVFRGCVQQARDRGQTVLLSSHILSEVEALCDRVAILRVGRVVELGRLDQLRHLAALDLEITFTGPLPDLSKVDGISDVRVGRRSLTCRLHGSMQPLLQALAPYSVQRLLSREPSLEELFLAHYGRGPDQPVGEVRDVA